MEHVHIEREAKERGKGKAKGLNASPECELSTSMNPVKSVPPPVPDDLHPEGLLWAWLSTGSWKIAPK